MKDVTIAKIESILEKEFAGINLNLKADIMTDRKPVLYINDEKCRNSYSCVRVCPVNAIEVKPQKAHPFILPDRCIGCGLCFVSCTPHAIEFRDSREEVKQLLSSGRKTAPLLNPALLQSLMI